MRILIRGLIAIFVSAVIWWFGRNRGDRELKQIKYMFEDYEVYKALFVSNPRLLPPKNKAKFKKWWKSLSDEERDEVIKTIQNPLGNKEEY